jgi:hypothetical protein
MRKIAGWMLVWGVVLAVAPNVFAGDQEDALAIVEQAIKAHGGADGLNKAQTVVRTGSGTMMGLDKAVPFTDEITWSLPDKVRMAVELDKKDRVLIVVNGDKGWQSAGGASAELGADRVREFRDENYVQWLATLTPLKKDEFKLEPVPEIKVNGEPAVGIKATSKAAPNGIKLYFDKKTNLLVKIERRARLAGVAVDKEYVFSEHKEFDGVKLATKQVELLNGHKASELTSATYKFPKKIDDATFAKP